MPWYQQSAGQCLEGGHGDVLEETESTPNQTQDEPLEMSPRVVTPP
jgi:hypothetical protein